MNRILIPILLFAVLAGVLPVTAIDIGQGSSDAGTLYSKSVDLANDGKYSEALDVSDKALALNETSMTGLIQSNRAGILVMLKRYDEAITAADAALAVQGNLTIVHSIAYYNKGNALRELGRISEARDAYSHAYALDNTLVPPDLGTTPQNPSQTKAPAGFFLPVAAVVGAMVVMSWVRKR